MILSKPFNDFYFNFFSAYSRKSELDSMFWDLKNLKKDTQYEQDECLHFIKELEDIAETAKILHRYLHTDSEVFPYNSKYADNEYFNKYDEYLRRASNLDIRIKELIFQFFFKKGRENILKETLFQENCWKYLICYDMLQNAVSPINSFINSLNKEEQIDIYLLVSTTYSSRWFEFYVKNHTSSHYFPTDTNWFLWICEHNTNLAINLLSTDFKGIKQFNGISIDHNKYRSLTTLLFGAYHYIRFSHSIMISGQSIVETQLFFISQASTEQRKHILKSLSNFDIINILYSSELQNMVSEVKPYIINDLQKLFNNMKPSEKEEVYLIFYDLSINNYIEFLKSVDLEQRLDIINVLNSKQINEIIDTIGIIEFRKLLF